MVLTVLVQRGDTSRSLLRKSVYAWRKRYTLVRDGCPGMEEASSSMCEPGVSYTQFTFVACRACIRSPPASNHVQLQDVKRFEPCCNEKELDPCVPLSIMRLQQTSGPKCGAWLCLSQTDSISQKFHALYTCCFCCRGRVELPVPRFLTRSAPALNESMTLRKRMRCSSVFVSNRLKSLALLPELLPWFHDGTGITCVFGMERVFPLCGFARGIGASCESMNTLFPVFCRIADMH
jgi:hypothetical protein